MIIAHIKSCVNGPECSYVVDWGPKHEEALLPCFLETRNFLEELRTSSLLNLVMVIVEAVVLHNPLFSN